MMAITFAPTHLITPVTGAGSPIGSGRTAAPRTTCYHCASPLDDAIALHTGISGKSREFRCVSRQTVAQTLHASGMGHIYNGPIAFAKPIEGDHRTGAEAAWVTYSLPTMRERFVRPRADGSEELSLAISGIHYAACVWLIERALSRMPDMREATVSYATERTRIVGDAGALRLSAVFTAITDVGYKA